MTAQPPTHPLHGWRWIAALLLLIAPGPGWPLDPDLRFWNAGVKYVGWDEGMPDAVTDVAQDRRGFIWATTHQGLIRFDGGEPRNYDVSQYPELLSNRLERLIIAPDDALYLLSAKGVSRYRSGRFETVAERGNLGAPPVAIAVDADGRVWVATAQQLFHLESRPPRPVFVPGDIGLISALAALDRALYAGGSGGFAVYREGAWRGYDLPAGFETTEVRDFARYQGRVWVATGRGAFVLDGDRVVAEGAEELRGASLNSALADGDGSLWLAGRAKLIRRFPDGAFETPDLSLDEFGIEPFIRRVFEDRDGALWFASTTFSLIRVRAALGNRISYQEGLASIAVSSVAADSTGRIWVGTDDGVYTIASERAALALPGSELPHRSVLTLYFDDSDRLWIGTTAGITVHAGGEDRTPSALRGLSGTPVLAVAEDGDGFWIGTREGLFRLRDEELMSIDGLDASEIRTLLAPTSGVLWIGTHSGLYAFRDGVLEHAGTGTPLEDVVVTALIELPGGALVAASQDNGLFVYGAGRWRHLSRSAGVPINGVTYLSTADGHYLWAAGTEGIYRIPLIQLDDDTRETVDARVLAYAGKTIRGADYVNCCRGGGGSNGLFHDDRLWLPTRDGLFILGIDAKPPWNPAIPAYIDAVVLGERRIDEPAPEQIILGPAERKLRLEFGALALTAHMDARFRYRLQGHDSQWIDGGKAATAAYANLKPGSYLFEVQAGLDRDVWGDPARLGVIVQPRLYETVWFRVLLALLGMLALAALLWLRLTLLKRKQARIEADIAKRTAELKALNVELSAKNLQLLEASHTDPLTGLLNRRFLLPVLESRGEPVPQDLSQRLEHRSAVVLLDVDDFKSVNDRFGHLAGDEVLRRLARLLRTLTRADDLVIRWGGEEFLLVCAEAQGDLAHLAERIRAGLAGHEFVLRSGQRLKLTCSIGAVACPLWGGTPDPVSWDGYLAAADHALFAVKRHGRDGWACLTAGAREPTPEQVGWLETRLVDLIEAGILAASISRDQIRLVPTAAR